MEAILLLLLILAAIVAAYFAICGVVALPGWLLYSRLEDRSSRSAGVLRGVGIVWMVLAWLGVTGLFAALGLPLPY